MQYHLSAVPHPFVCETDSSPDAFPPCRRIRKQLLGIAVCGICHSVTDPIFFISVPDGRRFGSDTVPELHRV